MSEEQKNESRCQVQMMGSEICVQLTSTEDTKRCEAIIKTGYIPVIFLPGVMGSNLKAQKNYEKGFNEKDTTFINNYLWNVDIEVDKEVATRGDLQAKAKEILTAAGTDDALKVWVVHSEMDAARYLWMGAVFRQGRLNPDTTTVDYFPFGHKDGVGSKIRDAILNLHRCGPGAFDQDDNTIDLATAIMRGWGSVSASSYWKFLANLQKALDALPPMSLNETCEKIQQMVENNTRSSKWKRLFAAAQHVETIQGKKVTLPPYSPIYSPKLINTLYKPDDVEKLDPKRYIFFKDSQQSLQPLSYDELKQVTQYRYVVFASGYNWLHSNAVSAVGGEENRETGMKESQDHHHLSKVIDKILQNVRKKDPDCNQVILVTHSMGGLVARAYTKVHADKVLGVINSVQPATGSGAFYKRIRAGFGGVENASWLHPIDKLFGAGPASVLGNNTYETSVVMTHGIGPLELAPSDSYGDAHAKYYLQQASGETKNYQSWLKVIQKGQVLLELPTLKKNGKVDPYEEIYKSRAWYGLVPAYDADNDENGQNNKRIDPSGKFNYQGPNSGQSLSDLAYFAQNIQLASDYHLNNVTKSTYHDNTYASVTIDHGIKSYGEVVIELEKTTQPITDIALWKLKQDDGKGNMLLESPDGKRQVKAWICKKTDAGDETVPGISSIAPAGYIKELWQTSDGKTDHQKSWQAKNVQLFSLYAIGKIVQSKAKQKCQQSTPSQQESDTEEPNISREST